MANLAAMLRLPANFKSGQWQVLSSVMFLMVMLFVILIVLLQMIVQ